MKALADHTHRRFRWGLVFAVVSIPVALFLAGAVYESRHPFLPGDYEWVAPDLDLVKCENLILRAEPRLDPAIARYYAFHISRAAKESGVPAELAVAVIHCESRWNPLALSRKGARGLGQHMPESQKARLEKYGNTEDEAYYVEVQIRDTCETLAENLKRFPTPQLAVAAYNCGPNNAAIKAGRVPQNRETPAYTRDVLAMYAQLKMQTMTVAAR